MHLGRRLALIAPVEKKSWIYCPKEQVHIFSCAFVMTYWKICERYDCHVRVNAETDSSKNTIQTHTFKMQLNSAEHIQMHEAVRRLANQSQRHGCNGTMQ